MLICREENQISCDLWFAISEAENNWNENMAINPI